MLKRVPIRHHYIPQFILRNFCFDDQGNTFYRDIKSKEETKKSIRDLFMKKNLYRDSINNENPVKIEQDFSRFENEVAYIIKEKFLRQKEFTLTQNENEKLKLFFILMSFRAQNTNDYFSKDIDRASKKFYSHWQRDKNFDDFWKRNLGKIINCRSLQEVVEREDIDEPIKLFLLRDGFGFFGKYFCIVEPKDLGEFVLSDCYPVEVTGEYYDSLSRQSREVPLFDLFPISPNRAILLSSIGVENSQGEVLGMRPMVFIQPKITNDKEMVFRVKKLYLEEVEKINNMIISNAMEGFIHKNIIIN